MGLYMCTWGYLVLPLKGGRRYSQTSSLSGEILQTSCWCQGEASWKDCSWGCFYPSEWNTRKNLQLLNELKWWDISRSHEFLGPRSCKFTCATRGLQSYPWKRSRVVFPWADAARRLPCKLSWSSLGQRHSVGFFVSLKENCTEIFFAWGSQGLGKGSLRSGILDSVFLRLAVYVFFFSFSGYTGFLWATIMPSVFTLTQ